MKLKNKIKLGAIAAVGAVVTTVAAQKFLDKMIKENLSHHGITHPKKQVMSKQNQDDFANHPETILGQLFHTATPQITLSIPNRDGRHINALLYSQDAPSAKYAIIVHGYCSGVKAVSYLSKRYFEAGYNVLVPYMRAHRGSDYEYCTMGWHERFDIIDWINYIDRTVAGASVVLHGVSMGAATVMMTTGESLPTCVRCAIEDCGYTSVYDAYRYKIPKMMGLPAFPCVDIFRHAIKSKVGFDIKEASALAQVRKSCTPTLFIHGESDTVVPVSMAYELHANAACEKELLIITRAEHAMSPLVESENYWSAIWSFIERYSR